MRTTTRVSLVLALTGSLSVQFARAADNPVWLECRGVETSWVGTHLNHKGESYHVLIVDLVNKTMQEASVDRAFDTLRGDMSVTDNDVDVSWHDANEKSWAFWWHVNRRTLQYIANGTRQPIHLEESGSCKPVPPNSVGPASKKF